jgi:hypothetical protein
LRYMREHGYLTENEHQEISQLFQFLMSKEKRRAARVIEYSFTPETVLGAAASNIMYYSIQYWNDKPDASITGDRKGRDRPQQTDDPFYDSTLKAAGDVLGLLIAAVTGVGTIAAGGMTIACSYIMDVVTGCMNHPPSLYPCNNDLGSSDYWDDINIPPPDIPPYI